jgi:hypothetical protein
MSCRETQDIFCGLTGGGTMLPEENYLFLFVPAGQIFYF